MRASTKQGSLQDRSHDVRNWSALVLPLCFLAKPQSSITAEGWLSYSQRLTVCLTITSVSAVTSGRCLDGFPVHTERSRSLVERSHEDDLT